jgi:hypothetical protein
MSPPRPLLNIEMFEDRLLPSSFAIGGIDPTATFPTNTFHVSNWHQLDATASDSGREASFISQSPANPNSTSHFQDQATPSEDTAFPILSSKMNYVGFSQGSSLQSFRDSFRNLESSDATLNNLLFNSEASTNNLQPGGVSSPQPVLGEASFPQPVIVVVIGLGGDGLNRFSDFRNVADSPDGQWPPWFNHDYETSGINPPDGTNSSDPPSGSVGDNGSSQADSVAPLEVAAPSSPPPSAPASAPSTPEQFLASISPQPSGGQSTIFGQLPPSEQHILSEITLAAVSLMGSQAAPSTPMLPPVVIASPGSTTELPLPSATADRTTLRVKAPTPVPVKEMAEVVLEAPLPPIEIHAPSGVPVTGAVGLDADELDARVSRVLASISNLGVELTEELEQPEAYAWLVAAGLLSLGAGYVVWTNQKSQRVVGFPYCRGSLGVWEGEEYDARNR